MEKEGFSSISDKKETEYSTKTWKNDNKNDNTRT